MKLEEIDRLVQEYFKYKGLPCQPALTFDDVIIQERISSIASRSDITSLRAQLAKNFFLNIPLVSANMDTVTDSKMAIALARLGGLGFIHQFSSLEHRVEEVKKVKRADNTIIENPATINYRATLRDAKELMEQYQVSCLLAVNKENALVGILTSRDIFFEENLGVRVEDLMTSVINGKFVSALAGISNEEAMEILRASKVEKLPLVDGQGKVVGLMTAKDILKRRMFPNAARDEKGQLLVGATLRFKGDCVKEAEVLLEAGADVLLLDTARAGSSSEKTDLAVEKTFRIKKQFLNAVLVVGNTTNPEAVALLAKSGADCVKIGVGPGAGCKTQEVAGVGAPQLHAIAECAAVAKEAGVYLIGDGGIRNSACLAKALVAGANSVMIGSLFAGTDESPGLLVWDRKENKLVKKYRGSASLDHQLERVKVGDLDAVRNPEGESGEVPYMGSLASVVSSLLDGLRSGMSYVGAHNLDEFQELGRFQWRSQSATEEGRPRI